MPAAECWSRSRTCRTPAGMRFIVAKPAPQLGAAPADPDLVPRSCILGLRPVEADFFHHIAGGFLLDLLCYLPDRSCPLEVVEVLRHEPDQGLVGYFLRQAPEPVLL